MSGLTVLHKIFGARTDGAAAASLYAAAVEAARCSPLYEKFGVPDSVDGRFEMIALHVYLLLRRLRGTGADGGRIAQNLFDAMFDDMDRSLREMGAGDLGVGRRVKAMAKALYGRISAYDAALDDADPAALVEAIERNVFRGDARAMGADGLAGYLRDRMASLERQETTALIGGRVNFEGGAE
jgi:cytochrome b pre-mRNA-processing protein 3